MEELLVSIRAKEDLPDNTASLTGELWSPAYNLL